MNRIKTRNRIKELLDTLPEEEKLLFNKMYNKDFKFLNPVDGVLDKQLAWALIQVERSYDSLENKKRRIQKKINNC